MDQLFFVVFDLMQYGIECYFFVFDEWYNLIGMLGECRFVKFVKDKKFDFFLIFFSSVICFFFDVLFFMDLLDEVYGKVYWKGCGIFLVFYQGKLVGVVDENGLLGLLKVKWQGGINFVFC